MIGLHGIVGNSAILAYIECIVVALVTLVAINVIRFIHTMKRKEFYCDALASMLIAVIVVFGPFRGFSGVNAQVPFQYGLRGNNALAIPLTSLELEQFDVPFICPNGTGYVFDTRTSDNTFLGCAPEGKRSCVAPLQEVIAGACEDGEFCCFHGLVYVGCAQTQHQCCFNQICPVGFTCCGDRYYSRCCPIPLMDPFPTLAGEYCDLSTESLCNETIGVQCPYIANATLCDEQDSYNACRNSSSVYCQDVNQCVLGEDTAIYNYLNATTGDPLEFYQEIPHMPVICCPVGSEVCYNRNNEITGCADPARNETCCGILICSDGYQCCTFNQTIEGITGNQVTQLVRASCCPNEFECCSYNKPSNSTLVALGIPLADDLFPTLQDVFCGLPIVYTNETTLVETTESCGIDATVSDVVKFFRLLFREGAEDDV